MKLLLLVPFSLSLLSAEPVTLPLWDGPVPGEDQQKIGPEKTIVRKNDDLLRLTNVTKPTLTHYPAPADKATGAAVIVAPGGGYSILAYSHEGTEVCRWLNDLGVSAILLKYRTPRRQNLAKHHAPLHDAQRAVSLVRSKAEEWQIDPTRLGFLGFSAGGHLTATVLTSDGSVTFPKEKVDAHSPIPNFGILVYPAYLKDPANPNQLVPEVKVDADTPPCFLVVGHQDTRFVEGAALFYLAMQRAQRPCELHIFDQGGHGFGMKKIPQRIGNWPQIAGAWMKESGFLEEQKK
mgnify:CR=1 FL=1